MVTAADPYAVLGVSRTASEQEIRKAYRRLAKQYHPDVNAGKPEAEEKFKAISVAYEILSDKDRRKLYDEFGHDGLREGFDPQRAREYARWNSGFEPGVGARPGGFRVDVEGTPFDLGDLFSELFGKGRRQETGPQPGQDIYATVEIDFAEALRGTSVRLQVPRQGGSEVVTVRIPAGADDGSKLRVAGKGMLGRGGRAGDLVIETVVRPHPHFKRDGLDLYLTLPVTVAEAYNGASIEVPTPDGQVKLVVPPRSQQGGRLRLRGKGVQRGRERGDLFVTLDVRLPERDDPELARALERAAGAYAEPVRRGIVL